MRRVELPESWRAVVIAEVDDPQSWFEDVPRFKLPKRREEWMLSRIAGQILARELGAAPPWISYSHSAPYAGAAASGIDVQVIREIDARTAHLFLTDAESAAVRGCNVEHRLLHWWCAKEAAWKDQRGVIPTLKRVPLVLRDERENGLVFENVETVAIDDVIVALTRPIS